MLLKFAKNPLESVNEKKIANKLKISEEVLIQYQFD